MDLWLTSVRNITNEYTTISRSTQINSSALRCCVHERYKIHSSIEAEEEQKNIP